MVLIVFQLNIDLWNLRICPWTIQSEQLTSRIASIKNTEGLNTTGCRTQVHNIVVRVSCFDRVTCTNHALFKHCVLAAWLAWWIPGHRGRRRRCSLSQKRFDKLILSRRSLTKTWTIAALALLLTSCKMQWLSSYTSGCGQFAERQPRPLSVPAAKRLRSRAPRNDVTHAGVQTWLTFRSACGLMEV